MRFAPNTLLCCMMMGCLLTAGFQSTALAQAKTPDPQLDALQKQAAAAAAQKTASEKTLTELRGQLKALVDQLNKLKAGTAAAQNTVKTTAPTLKKQQDAVKAVTTAKQQADTAAAAAQKAFAAAQKAAAEAKAKADASVKTLAAAQAALKKTEDDVAKANAVIQKSAAEVKTAETGIAAVQPKVMAQQQQLAALAAETLAKQKTIEAFLAKQGKFVSFSDQIAPIFSQRCLACHNARTAKGRYNMESFTAIFKGGESGAAITAGKPGDSNLFSQINDGAMPKDADPLTKAEIALIKKWIDNGAKLNAGVSAAEQLTTIIPKLTQPNPPQTYRVPIPVTAVAYSPDGKWLASSGYHEVILWNPTDGNVVRRITNIAERVYDVEFSPDGKTLAVAAGTPGQMGEAKLFNVADGKLLADLVATNDSVFSVAFSPDGKRVAAAGADRGIRVYEVATQIQLVLVEDHADWVMAIAWSPDGTKLASASRDKTSKVFDMSPRKIDPTSVALGTQPKNLLSGESLATFNSHGEPVFDVAFSADGKSVITSGADKQIRVWNPTNGKQVRAIGGFGDQVFRISVTKDGRVFSSSADKTARVHTIANGAAVKTFGGHTDWVYSVGFDAKNNRVATGSYNGEIRVFNVADGKQLTLFTAAPGYKPPTVSAKK